MATGPFAPNEFIYTTKRARTWYRGLDIQLANDTPNELGVELRLKPMDYGEASRPGNMAISAWPIRRSEPLTLSKHVF